MMLGGPAAVAGPPVAISARMVLLPGSVLWRSLVGLDEILKAEACDLGYLAERYLYLLFPRIFQTVPGISQNMLLRERGYFVCCAWHLGVLPDAYDHGEPESLPVGPVHFGKAFVLLWREAVETRRGLFPGGLPGQLARHRRLAREVRVRPDQGNPLLSRGFVHRSDHGPVQLGEATEGSRPPRALRHPGRALEDRPQSRDELVTPEPVHLFQRHPLRHQTSSETRQRKIAS